MLAATTQFSKPTLIQSLCWPLLKLGLDVIGIAETGSGKTLAFGIPMMEHFLSTKSNVIDLLVLAPTRELAQQTFDQLELVGKGIGNISGACIYGGVAKGPQQYAIKKKQICCWVPWPYS